MNGSLKPDSATKNVLKKKFHEVSKEVKEMKHGSSLNVVKFHAHFITRSPKKMLEKGPKLLAQKKEPCQISYLGSSASWSCMMHVCWIPHLGRMWSMKKAGPKHQNVVKTFAVHPPWILSSRRGWKLMRLRSAIYWNVGFLCVFAGTWFYFISSISQRSEAFGWIPFLNN